MKTRMQRIRRPQRRGVATMWFLAGFSVLFVLFLFLIELGSLWTARVEVENSLEAAALAAAESWGTSAGAPMANWTNTARLRGQTLAAANNVNGNPVVIGTNLGTYDLGTNPNENSAYLPAPGAIGNLVFGSVTEMGNTVTFDATFAPQCGGATEIFGVRAQATIAVPSLFGSYFGLSYSTYNVTVNATAIYDCGNGLSRLVRVDNYIHP